MTEQAAARRMRILDELLDGREQRDLTAYAREFGVDERTVRRDVDYLHEVVTGVSDVGLHRGRVYAEKEWRGPGYFGRQVDSHRADKEQIARAVVQMLPDNVAIVVTAGSTTFQVARELRRSVVEDLRPANLIAFTNSLPALMEFASGLISTGVIGEIYNADDRAFHSSDFSSAFQPSLAIVGASGVIAHPSSGLLELYSHRAEEAAFLKQVLAPIPELIVAVDATKIGHRHPWAFTNASLLAGKRVRLVTNPLPNELHEALGRLEASAQRSGWTFTYQIA